MTGPDGPAAGEAFRPAARAAARWWVQLITAPGRSHPVPPAAAAVFAAALETGTAEGIAAEAARPGRRPSRVSFTVRVDYHPDQTLKAAAAAAGLDEGCLPIKTTMLARPDHVIVSWGYGAPYQLVWSAAGWQRPLCDHLRPEDGWERWMDFFASPDLMKCGRARWHDGPHGDWVPDLSRCASCGRPETAHYTRAGWSAGGCAYKDAGDGP